MADWASVKAHALQSAVNWDSDSRRHPSSDAEYRVYKEWISSQGLDNHDYVVRFTPLEVDVALVPNLAPYHTEAGISHWVLWHHPSALAGDMELDPEAESERVRELLGMDVGKAAGLVLEGAVASAREHGPRGDELALFQNVRPLLPRFSGRGAISRVHQPFQPI